MWDDGPAGGETATDVRRRADHVIAVARAEVGPVLAFTHGHFARVLGARWIGLTPEDGRLLGLDTGAICVLGFERETAVILRWG